MPYGRPLTRPEVSPPVQPLARAEILLIAWLGTAIAGGLYPTVQMILISGLPRLPEGIFELVVFGMVAFVFGFLYAGLVGAFVLSGAAIVAACTKIERTPIWLASIAGGWTGFLCALPMRTEFSDNPWVDVLLAAFMGQVGAAWITQVAVQRNRRKTGAEASPREKLRIGLRQLFAATTILCILAGSIGALRPSREVYQLMAAATILQSLMILTAIGVRQLLPARHSDRRPSAHSAFATPPAASTADAARWPAVDSVPRETPTRSA